MPAIAGAALPYVRSAVGLDPDDAGTHALLLRFLTESGGKDAAEEQYAVSLRQLRDNDVPVEPLVAAWRELRRKAPCAQVPRRRSSATGRSSAPVWSGVERKFATVLVACVHRAVAGPSTSDPEELSRQADTLAALRPLIEGFGGMMGVTLGDFRHRAVRRSPDAGGPCGPGVQGGARHALRHLWEQAGNSGGELDLSACLDAGEVLVRTGARRDRDHRTRHPDRRPTGASPAGRDDGGDTRCVRPDEGVFPLWRERKSSI